MGAHYFKHNKVPLFARKPWNINVLRSAALKLASVPVRSYYCVIKYSFVNVCVKFH